MSEELIDAARDVVASMDDPDFIDKSYCAYNRRGAPGADPDGICSYGCVDEPSCHTDGPWPMDRLRLAVQAFDENPRLIPTWPTIAGYANATHVGTWVRVGGPDADPVLLRVVNHAEKRNTIRLVVQGADRLTKVLDVEPGTVIHKTLSPPMRPRGRDER
jgi:hypothetical protein